MRQYYAEHRGQWSSYNTRRKHTERDTFVEDVAKLVVLELHDGVCGICGDDVDPGSFHLDHIIPLSAGGWHGYDNVQPSHPACNLSKGSR